MSSEDNYIFKENIRHPSKQGDWITIRDCVTIAEPSEQYYEDNQTATVTQFIVDSYSYNYTPSGNQWLNDVDNINNNSITISGIDSKLISDLDIKSTITTTPTVTPTASVQDIISTTIVNTKYDNDSIILIPNNENNFTNWITTNNIDNDSVHTGDTIIIPSFNNQNLSLTGYQFSKNITTSDIYPTTVIDFDSNAYATSTIQDLDILNIMKTSGTYTNNITLEEIWNTYCEPVYTMTVSAGVITNIQGTTTDNLIASGTSNVLYGNGVILNRYDKIGSELSAIKFDYSWVAMHDNDNNNYIIKFKFDSSTETPKYIIDRGFLVNIDTTTSGAISISKIDAIINTYSVILFSGWSGNLGILWQNYPLFDLPDKNIWYANKNFDATNSINKVCKTDDDITTLIKGILNNTISGAVFNRQDTNHFRDSNNASPIINIKTNKQALLSSDCTWNLISADNSTFYKYIWGDSGNTYLRLSYNNQDTNIGFSFISSNVTTILSLWDSIIKNEQITPIQDIFIQLDLKQIKGQLSYGNSSIDINDYYQLTPIANFQINNVFYGNDITQLWNQICITTNNDLNFSSGQLIQLIYNNTNESTLKCQYRTNQTLSPITKSCNNKIWIAPFEVQLLTTNDDTNHIVWIKKDHIGENIDTIVHNSFKQLCKNDYTKVKVIINIPEDEDDISWQTVHFTKHEWQHSFRLYGGDNKLLNLGSPNIPVYIRDGQFFECVGLKDILIAANAPDESAYAGESLWIDTDD